MSEPLVALRGIAKRFGGVHAVEDVDLDLFAGEVVGVLGHNGAGKSTLMKGLSGAQPVDAGTIRIAGREVAIRSPRDARELGVETLYQNLALAENLDAAANLFLGRELTTRFGTLDHAGMERVTRELVPRLNPRFARFREPVRLLSGGERQTIAIARAVHFETRVLILDEPTAALGPQETRAVADLIQRLAATGIGIFLVSHDLNDVFALADRVAVMKAGRVVVTCRTDEVTPDDVLAAIVSGRAPGDPT